MLDRSFAKQARWCPSHCCSCSRFDDHLPHRQNCRTD
jgi:hypothetical protein